MLKFTFNPSGMQNERDHLIRTLAEILAHPKRRLVDGGKELGIEIDGKFVASIDVAEIHPSRTL